MAATEASEEAEAKKHQVAERINERRQSLVVDRRGSLLPGLQPEARRASWINHSLVVNEYEHTSI